MSKYGFCICFGAISVLSLLLLSSNASAESRNLIKPISYKNLVEQILANAPNLSANVAHLATEAISCATSNDGQRFNHKLAIIDYSLPSSSKRFWLFDLKQPGSGRSQLLLEDYVAHGKNSGEDQAINFSNQPGSFQSSLGLFKVGERYVGKHGNSLRLIGLEPGINDLAQERAIVIHGADYVSKNFIAAHKRLGRSQGCPALSPTSVDKVIENFERDGGFLFSYYPDKKWLSKSEYLRGCKSI